MPRPVITIDQMRAWEQATWATGQTENEVIRRVSVAVARLAARLTCPEDLIVILAGKGHNGNDARRAQEHLQDRRVECVEGTDPKAALPVLEAVLAREPALLVDGLFGIGLDRPLDPEWVRLIERVNASGVPVLSVDVPSGLNADTGEAQGAAIQAAVTLTVGAPKTGLMKPAAWPFTGRLEVAGDVGLAAALPTSELQWTLPEDFRGFPPRRAAAAHKGTHGHLAIVAGSLGYHGAAVLAARGAQRAQPGLITLYPQEATYAPVAAQTQAVMVCPWRGAMTLPESTTAALLGPGLAAPDLPDAMKLLTRNLWRDSALAVVVDASALDWVPMGPLPRNALRVITPHPGEAARLLRSSAAQVQANRLEALRGIAHRFGNPWVVLKGQHTLIGRGSGEVFVNCSGNPHLAQGGSGDVLSGYIAGLLAQPPLQADVASTLRYAVWQHGAAADRLQAERANWTVEDLVGELGRCC